jgi:crotonobetainyl-CoA:carnitine CoA-transferase CaiB-like acyl-CoA transferase
MDLDGIRVLDLTQLLPGPYGTQLLADMGAEVVKVEPPQGDRARLVRSQPGWSGYVFSAVNADKKSITLDLKQEQGREAFYRLVADADVVFEQFRPGVADRLGIDYETLVAHNDEIVYCSLTGYGQAGPYRDRAGHDLNYVGFAGLADMTRDDEGVPTPPGYPIADMTGGLMAVTSILGALLSRELGNTDRTRIDLSMTDAVLSYAQVEVAMADDGGDPRPGETPMSGTFPWYGVYETADGRYVTLAALEPRFWQTFCEAVKRPDLVEYHMTQDPEDRAWLREELAALFAEHTRAEWEDRLGAIDDAMFGLVNTPAEAIEDPHISERGILAETAAGHRRVRFPARTDSGTTDAEGGAGDAGDRPGALPDLGEHTDDLLAACGFDDEEIATLRDAGVV